MLRGSMPSVMGSSHSFSRAPQADIPRSRFDRSHGFKTTFDAGYLVPVFVDEALPGDTFSLDMTSFARLATPLHPFMDNLFLESFFFSIPYRLVWDNWQKFNGEQTDPGDSTDFECPVIAAPVTTGWLVHSLADYFGIPTQVTGINPVSFAFRAYNLVWNEWFRDQNLQDSVVVDKDDGPDAPADYVLLRRCKRHDYFTSCLPWTQKGPAVELPLGTTAPVIGLGVVSAYAPNGPVSVHETGHAGTVSYPMAYTAVPSPAGVGQGQLLVKNNGSSSADPLIYADLSAATAATINSLRLAFQTQKLYERDARGGTRYIEIIKSHFGVTSPDARLQRPEFLGGGSSVVVVNPIAQTSAVPSQPSTLGTLGAFGTVSTQGHGFTKSFTEHCIILGMVCVRADLNYQQGMNRMWSRSTRWDFYWPALAHIGEQAVLNQEIYAQGTSDDALVFGYQERFAEYRYKPSVITGQFRSNYSSTLDSWHLAQDFASLPLLNDEFIQESPPVYRVTSLAESYPDFLFDAYFRLNCARPMPVYSVPGLVDHF